MRNQRAKKRLVFSVLSMLFLLGAEILRIGRAYKNGSALDTTIALAAGIVISLLAIVLAVAIARRKNRRMVEEIRASHPDALIVKAFWSADLLEPFLRPGPLQKYNRGRVFHVFLVVDGDGIELVRRGAKPVYLGLINWDRIQSIHLEEFRAVIGSATRKALVIDHFGDAGPYMNRITLMPEGKELKAAIDDLPARMLRHRPATGSAGERQPWPPAYWSADGTLFRPTAER